MGETVTGEVLFAEPTETVRQMLAAISHYPVWNEGIRDARILTTDDKGRVLTASFMIDIKLTQLSYTLTYTYADSTVSWTLLDGDLLSQFDGSYTVTSQGDVTHVAYRITVDVTVALPKVMKRRAAETVLNQMLAGLRSQLTVATGA